MALRACSASCLGRAALTAADNARNSSGAMSECCRTASRRAAVSASPAWIAFCTRRRATDCSRRTPSRASPFFGSCSRTAPYNSRAEVPCSGTSALGSWVVGSRNATRAMDSRSSTLATGARCVLPDTADEAPPARARVALERAGAMATGVTACRCASHQTPAAASVTATAAAIDGSRRWTPTGAAGDGAC